MRISEKHIFVNRIFLQKLEKYTLVFKSLIVQIDKIRTTVLFVLDKMLFRRYNSVMK